MSLKKKVKHATVCAISASVLLGNSVAHADPTPQVPQRSTPSPQIPQRNSPSPQVPNRQATPVPAPVQSALPGVEQAAQPLVPQERVVYIESKPVVITEVQYVDRQVVEESGGLLILDPDVQKTIGPAHVYNAAQKNFYSRTGQKRVTLDRAAAAAGTGAVIGGVAGAAGGALLAGAGTGIAGGVVGGVAGTAAQIPAQVACGVTTVVAPQIGVPCHVIAAAAGPAAGAAVGATVGAGVGIGAGAVVGGTAGAAAGATAGAATVPGGTEALQSVAADTVWDLEDSKREEFGYKRLVGNKPSGEPGHTPIEQSTPNRITDGTVTGKGANVDPKPNTKTEQSQFDAANTPLAPAGMTQAQHNLNQAINQAQTQFTQMITSSPIKA